MRDPGRSDTPGLPAITVDLGNEWVTDSGGGGLVVVQAFAVQVPALTARRASQTRGFRKHAALGAVPAFRLAQRMRRRVGSLGSRGSRSFAHPPGVE